MLLDENAHLKVLHATVMVSGKRTVKFVGQRRVIFFGLGDTVNTGSFTVLFTFIKKNNTRNTITSWTEGNKGAEKHSSFQQSLWSQMLSVAMPRKPPGHEWHLHSQEASFHISDSSSWEDKINVVQGSMLKSSYSVGSNFFVFDKLLSTSVPLQSVVKIAHALNSSQPRSKDIYLLMLLF